MVTVTLPESVDEFASVFSRNVQSLQSLSPIEKIVWKYSGGALLNSRPLNTVMIFLVGYSGAGKSSTINVLFDDKNLCPTSSSKSETNNPVMLAKVLNVTHEESPATVVGKLAFVDLPGYLDTNNSNEEGNLAKINKFTDTRMELANRKKIMKMMPKWMWMFRMRNSVYPNLVLFVVEATDNRLDGPNSSFRSSLKTLKENGKLFDTAKKNLIVVLTHCMSLPRRKFTEKLKELTDLIVSIVRQELGIENVDVVPVENEPEDYDCEKFGDFYKLPNEQLSHHNLFNAMLKIFKENDDCLGRLFAGWYFGSTCPEKKQKAVLIQSEGINTPDVEASISSQEVVIPSHHTIFDFQSIGYGYCPVTETVKYDNLVGPGNVTQFEGLLFSIPECVRVSNKKASRFHRITFFEKGEYEQHKMSSYGIDLQLHVTAVSGGRWVKKESVSAETSTLLIRLVSEQQVANLKVYNPREQIQHPKFMEELENIPNQYNADTSNCFLQFFSKWGTHLICEQAIGGSIHFNCDVKNVSAPKLKEIELYLQTFLTSMVHFNSDSSYSSKTQELKEMGISNISFEINGGNPPTVLSLETLNYETLQEWVKTISKEPTELKDTMKLYPLYNLMDNDDLKYNSLRQATEDYLAGQLQLTMTENNSRDKLASLTVDEVVRAQPMRCFPSGTMVVLCDGQSTPIEKISSALTGIQTISLKQLSLNRKLKLNEPKATSFCTYLDQKSGDFFEYLVLHFRNGQTLVVSDSHLIFQYIRNGDVVIVKQAKYFIVGDMTIYWNKNVIETPEIVRISREMRMGAYSPLTMSGTFIADGFLVSSYADTDSFVLAQAALFPLKVWCKFRNKKNGKNKSVDAVETRNEIATTNGIHPFANFLLSVKKAISLMTQSV